ncbi:hypothetical protein [Rubellicoccus peritrichatus]|uniref:Uncharacterized protein n=1 Tax=Rubellicoccus peritrichatus TaxID=3080537 RepID=A0AAQ3LE69_9BACT|nr:hypothetical protein [Puniceicoccus sp. CR14]WOO43752.1 hypothetical protein RZN69_15165 [Puniceicoccus sp. CR14]
MNTECEGLKTQPGPSLQTSRLPLLRSQLVINRFCGGFIHKGFWQVAGIVSGVYSAAALQASGRHYILFANKTTAHVAVEFPSLFPGSFKGVA